MLKPFSASRLTILAANILATNANAIIPLVNVLHIKSTCLCIGTNLASNFSRIKA